MRDYDCLSAMQLKLLDKRIIDLVGEIDNKMCKYVREALMRLRTEGSPDIEVFITCWGGDAEVAIKIYDNLKLYTGNIAGIVVEYARSSAVLMLQACTVRRATEHCEIMIHSVAEQISLCVLKDQSSLKTRIDGMTDFQTKMDQIIHKRSGMSVEAIAKLCREETSLSSHEAKKLKLVDQIYG